VKFGSTFKVEAHFGKAHFHQHTSFSNTSFEGGADFFGAIFDGDTTFERTRTTYTVLDAAQFKGSVSFLEAELGKSKFPMALFKGSEPDFTGATIDQSVKATNWPHPWRAKPVGDTGKVQLIRRRTGQSQRT